MYFTPARGFKIMYVTLLKDWEEHVNAGAAIHTLGAVFMMAQHQRMKIVCFISGHYASGYVGCRVGACC